VVLAALINSLKIIGKQMKDLKVVVNGVGASGVACAKIMLAAGVENTVGCDSRGIVHRDRRGMNPSKAWFAAHTNPEGRTGGLAEAVRGADLFLGLSVPKVLTLDLLESMADDPIVFAMANPEPEIAPDKALGHVRVMATGRSDYPNQVNNLLAFPGIFRGALDVRARTINEEMKLAAARAIAAVVPEDHLTEDYVVPSFFDRAVVRAVAHAVAKAAQETGVARRKREQE
jgi:malate dehydrogenase (oxaloacetate-decarboxylating)